jgi:hypothetical protein
MGGRGAAEVVVVVAAAVSTVAENIIVANIWGVHVCWAFVVKWPTKLVAP